MIVGETHMPTCRCGVAASTRGVSRGCAEERCCRRLRAEAALVVCGVCGLAYAVHALPLELLPDSLTSQRTKNWSTAEKVVEAGETRETACV